MTQLLRARWWVVALVVGGASAALAAGEVAEKVPSSLLEQAGLVGGGMLASFFGRFLQVLVSTKWRTRKKGGDSESGRATGDETWRAVLTTMVEEVRQDVRDVGAGIERELAELRHGQVELLKELLKAIYNVQVGAHPAYHPPSPPDIPAPPPKVRVLLVEDGPKVRVRTERMLVRAGWVVTSVASVEEALRHLPTTTVLVTDYPEGVDTLLDQASVLGIKVIVYSGRIDRTHPDGVEVISKADPSKLVMAVRRLLV